MTPNEYNNYSGKCNYKISKKINEKLRLLIKQPQLLGKYDN